MPFRRALASLCLAAALALPAPAQEADPAPPPEAKGAPLAPLFERFAEELMREALRDIQPELERFMAELEPELQRLMAEIMPRLQELANRVDSLRHYQMPEMLPNGDIIIRRSPGAPPLPEDFTVPEGPIEL